MAKLGRPKVKHLDDVNRQIVKQFYIEGGWSIRRIAATLRASYWEVRNVLLQQGVTLRKRGRRSN